MPNTFNGTGVHKHDTNTHKKQPPRRVACLIDYGKFGESRNPPNPLFWPIVLFLTIIFPKSFCGTLMNIVMMSHTYLSNVCRVRLDW